MSVPLSFRRDTGTADPRQPQERCQQGFADTIPELNPSYQRLAEHYQVAVMPARPYKPKDKAKGRGGVFESSSAGSGSSTPSDLLLACRAKPVHPGFVEWASTSARSSNCPVTDF